MVEDDEFVADANQAIFLWLWPEAQVDVVTTGEDALRRCGGQAFDLVTMDDTLAGDLRGAETVAQLRDQGCDALIAMVSATATQVEGATFGWPKPLRRATIRQQW